MLLSADVHVTLRQEARYALPLVVPSLLLTFRLGRRLLDFKVINCFRFRLGTNAVLP